ncbi:MAG: twin-arginine translocation pathway signal protein [Pseudomonadota bacterium]
MNRRQFLTVAGGGIILAAGASIGHVATRVPKTALQPWAEAGSRYDEPRRNALSYAILAPNPHNRQPWLVDLSIPDTVVLRVDRERLLPHTDPFNRQITIGLGCFLEVMEMAAAANGYRVALELFPEGASSAALDDRPVAVAVFSKDATVAADPLFAHVLARRSLKEPYDTTRGVTTEILDSLKRAATSSSKVGVSNNTASVDALRRLTNAAMDIELKTPRAFKESVDLFRIGHREIDANPDGIDFSGPLFEMLHLTGQMTREGTLDTSSSMFAQGRTALLENTDTAMAYVWQVTTTNAREDQIGAGRDWVRINLAATAAGVGTQPLSQALQEYPEMKKLYAQVHDMLAGDGGTVQMLARLGYAEPVPVSPRWPLSAKIQKE